MNNLNKKLIIISAPSGCGKTTLSKMLIAHNKDFILSISATTRAKRTGEIDGKDYFFYDQNEFKQLIDSNNLLEYAMIYENYYGTPKKFVDEQLIKGKNIIFDIDFQGAKQLKMHKKAYEIISIFILPPSLKELQTRLFSRAQDDENIIAKRLQFAKQEIENAKFYDYVVVNDNLELCYQKIMKILNDDGKNYQDYSQQLISNLLAEECGKEF
jgi:guanylate kinase